MALWFSHTAIIAYPSHCTQYLFSTPNSGLYSEIRAKTISVTPNTNYLQAITGKKVGDIVVINLITDWKQWAPGRINVGHINATPIIFIAKKAILMDGSSGSIYAECNINIYENGNIEVVVPNEWQTGKLAHLVGIVTFLDQTI